ncbi:unnamed protein product [Clavelina lepadiformis]|uniref:Uncharacterized protein n=1 Tax=Clavelina lepadiformis TaxID=159417 RepID=A0ABP0FE94_CLALP
MSRFTADRRYNPQEVLRILRVDEDSDEEDFDEPEPSIREIDKECYIEQDVVQEESSSENDVPTFPNRQQIVSRDSTVWAPEFPPQNGRASKRNIIKTRPGTKLKGQMTPLVVLGLNCNFVVSKIIWLFLALFYCHLGFI